MNLSDLISQAEAASLRGVSRQAINDLIERGKLRGLSVGGRVMLSRKEVLKYKPQPAGRVAKKKKAKV